MTTERDFLHELVNPLAISLGYTKLLHQKLSAEPAAMPTDKVVSTLGIVLDGLTRIQQLVDEQRAALRQIDQDGSGVAGSK